MDVDGVVNTVRTHFAYHGHVGGYSHEWDVIACLMIKQLCDEFKCKIVISSTWRHNWGYLKERLIEHNLHKYVYSPDTGDRGTTRQGGSQLEIERGLEINIWIFQHAPDLKHFLILDDNPNMLDWQLPFFVKCDKGDGLSSRGFMKAYEILKNPPKIPDSVDKGFPKPKII